MRAYWDDRAQRNAAWYVDTTLDYDAPDMDQFLRGGEEIVAYALDGAPHKPHRNGAALEIGAGLGRVCRALADRFGHVVGIDVSEQMLKQAQDLIAHDHIVFVVGDGTNLAMIKDASIDFVLTFTVFQHIPNAAVVERYIQETARILRPGGMSVFQWNNSPGRTLWVLRRKTLSVLKALRLRTDRRGTEAPQFLGAPIAMDRMTRMVEQAGLRILKTDGLDTLFAWVWAERT
jgi:SAM-dependent methyltransferase